MRNIYLGSKSGEGIAIGFRFAALPFVNVCLPEQLLGAQTWDYQMVFVTLEVV